MFALLEEQALIFIAPKPQNRTDSLANPFFENSSMVKKNSFSYNSVQTHTVFANGEGKEQTMEVKIKNGRGYKKVTFRNNAGRKIASKTIDLNSDEIGRIMNKEFIPGLFGPCLDHCNNSARPSRRRTTRRNNVIITSNNN